MAKKYNLTEIVWRDASTYDNWQAIHIAVEEPADSIIHTAGWLLGEDKHHYILGTGISSNGNTAATWRIPKGMVLSKKSIKGFTLSHE